MRELAGFEEGGPEDITVLGDGEFLAPFVRLEADYGRSVIVLLVRDRGDDDVFVGSAAGGLRDGEPWCVAA